MLITIFVKPGKRECKVEKRGDYYYVWLKSQPIKGRANKELKKVLEKYFNKEVKKIIGKKNRKKKVVLK